MAGIEHMIALKTKLIETTNLQKAEEDLRNINKMRRLKNW